MAARAFTHPFSIQRDMVILAGKATGAGAADLTALNAPGVTSVKYNAATGKVKITLDDKYDTFLHLSGNVIDANSPDDWEVNVESEDVAGAKTISLLIFKGGTLADLTADEKLTFSISLRNTNRPF